MEMSVPFPGIDEMRRHAKAAFNEEFPNDQEMYLDAFRNGAFHEEEPDWYGIAGSLSDESLANLALSAIRFLVGGGLASAEGTTLKAVMNFHVAFSKYLSRTIVGGPEQLLEPLAGFRQQLFNSLAKSRSAWPQNFVRGFLLVDLAIHRRMGIHGYELISKYDWWLEHGREMKT